MFLIPDAFGPIGDPIGISRKGSGSSGQPTDVPVAQDKNFWTTGKSTLLS